MRTLFIISLLIICGAKESSAQTISERIDNYEYQADHGPIFHGWQAIYWYANDRDLGMKIAASVVVVSFVGGAMREHRDHGCSLNWWERIRARRQHRKRRSR